MFAAFLILVTLISAFDLVTLTDANFDNQVRALYGQTHDWLVLFCSPLRIKECADIVPLW